MTMTCWHEVWQLAKRASSSIIMHGDACVGVESFALLHLTWWLTNIIYQKVDAERFGNSHLYLWKIIKINLWEIYTLFSILFTNPLSIYSILENNTQSIHLFFPIWNLQIYEIFRPYLTWEIKYWNEETKLQTLHQLFKCLGFQSSSMP